MSLSKLIPSLSLAVALIGGGVMLTPSTAKADNGHISNSALRKGGIPQGRGSQNIRPGQPANKWTRGCSAINRCRG